jgi:tRNA (mo5U34)-methyltransferase
MTEQGAVPEVEGRYWYHTIELPGADGGPPIVTPGEYDHRPLVKHYGFPDDLGGQSVIDVGCADGFFSFELERRGAGRVVAVDRETYPGVPFHEVERFGQGQIHGSSRFQFARERLHSFVEFRQGDIHTLTAEEFGTYDLVFCGSLLLHLTDPLSALAGLRRVARNRLILTTAIYDERLLGAYERILGLGMRLTRKKTLVKFSALVQNEMDDTFWIPTKAALVNMVERNGFRDVRVHSTFKLDRRDGRRGWPHAVIHARV